MATAIEPQQRDESRPVTVTPRSIPVSHGRTIVVRSVTPQDETGLAELYDGLDDGDRYLRFFCAYRPSLEFIQNLANPGRREARVVAELIEPTAKRLVAEAGYSLLADGNGEFAMVVAREWRGWLGPYLLDLVVDLAAANHVPNLEAEVLAMNTTMLALLRARGCAFLGHDGWNEYHMMIGTGHEGPSWPAGHDRPRVLVETPGGHWPLEDSAEAAGMQVITCAGPGQNPSCPVLNGRECPLVACADAIVVGNRPGDPTWETLTRSHSDTHPDIPVIVDPTGDHTQVTPLEDIRVPALFHFYLQTSAGVPGERPET
jgi:hypothetical protein